MTGTTKEIYTVEGTQFQTVESLRAIQRAKEEAMKAKATKLVYLNSNPVLSIDKKGKMTIIYAASNPVSKTNKEVKLIAS
ncbi:MAG: hypothetical protein JWR05_3528 [Mucilaginibacter sp.]|nr:hypothetical protein [Mucilaginibacter sp.]